MAWQVATFDNRFLDQLDRLPPDEWQSNAYDLFMDNDWQPWFHAYQVVDGSKLLGFGMLFHFNDVAWLGWIVVSKKYRGKGIGSSISKHLISESKKLGADKLILTATELGCPIYEKLGFKTTSHYHFLTAPAQYRPIFDRSKIKKADNADMKTISQLDKLATGENRAALLESHLENTFVYSVSTMEGFFVESLGDGFIVASTTEAGENLMNFRLKKNKNKVAIPDGNTELLKALKSNGFTETAKIPRMTLGNEPTWKPAMIYNRGTGYCG